MLYPLSYRRMGPARNVVGNPAIIAPGVRLSVLVSPLRRRSGLDGPISAGPAYRRGGRGCASSHLEGAGVAVPQFRAQAAVEVAPAGGGSTHQAR